MAKNLNLNVDNELVYWPCVNVTRVKVAGVLASGTWGTAVVEIMQSLDAENWFSFVTPIELSAEGITALIDARGVNYIAAKVTTPEGAAGTADFTLGGHKRSEADIPDDDTSSSSSL